MVKLTRHRSARLPRIPVSGETIKAEGWLDSTTRETTVTFSSAVLERQASLDDNQQSCNGSDSVAQVL